MPIVQVGRTKLPHVTHQYANPFRITVGRIIQFFRVLVLSVLLGVGCPSFAAPGQDEGGSGDTTIIVDFKLNSQAFGEIEIVRSADGDFWLRTQDLVTFQVKPVSGASERTIGGQAHISIKSLGALNVAFDERTLSLSVSLPAALFPIDTTIQYQQGFAVRATDSPFSSFFNYRAAASRGDTSDTQQYTLAAEVGFRLSGILFRHEASWVRSGSLTDSMRLATQAIYDDTERLNRWTLGDAVATSGTLGSNLSVIGLNLTRLYAINPSFVRQPLATFGGSALIPSQIEVLASGVPIYRGDIKPGPFELRDLYYASGARTIDVRIRDALGRVENITFPFYFAEGLLAKGLSEYSFSLGRRRETPLLFDAGKSRHVALGFYRTGLTDYLTLGVRGEASRDLWNVGPTLASKSDQFGVVELAYSASKRQADAARGNASSLAYTYASPLLTGRYSQLRYSDTYANLVSLQADARPLRGQRLDFTSGNNFLGTFSLAFGATTFANGKTERTNTLGWNRTVFGRIQLFASISEIRGDRQERRGFIGLSYNLNAEENALATTQKTKDGNTQSLQFAHNVPQGEGLGYRVELERASTAAGRQLRIAPFAQYNFSGASVAINALDQISAGGQRSKRAEVSLAGGIGCVMDSCLPSRTITDSFAIVDLGVPIADVRILRNNQLTGKTNAAGKLMVSDLGSYYETEVRLNDRDLPIEYGFKLASQRISPAFRSGSRIDFGVKRIFSVFGKLVVSLGKRQFPLADYLAVLTRDGRRKMLSTESDGTFSLEDMETGKYTSVAIVDGKVCQFELTVPETEGIMFDAKDIVICR